MFKKVLFLLAIGALLGCEQPSSSDSDDSSVTTPTVYTYYITSLGAEVGDSLIKLSWTNPDEPKYLDDGVEETYTDDFYTTIVYDNGNGDSGSELVSGGSATIRDLINAEEYTFTLVARSVDYAGIETEEVTISAIPIDDGIDPIEDEISVSSLSELNSKIDDLTEGQIITLDDGDYSGDFNSIVDKYGSETLPIVIKAQTTGGVTIELDDIINIEKSGYVTIQGFIFKGGSDWGMLKVTNSENITIEDCIFDEEFCTDIGKKTVVISAGSGLSNDLLFDHNSFKDKNGKGAFITVEYDDSFGISTDITISNNYFLNMMPLIDSETGDYSGDSDREAISLGDSSSANYDTNYIVEYNLFEDCDGENEIVTNKTSSNIYRYNTFKNCFGNLSMRFGDDHQVYGNYFYGDDSATNDWETNANYETGGIRTYGKNQTIYNNFMYNLTGTSTWRMPMVIDGGSGSDYTAVQNSIIAFNTISDCYQGMGVGINKDGETSNNDIANNLISNSTDYNIIIENGSDSNFWEGNISYPLDKISIEDSGVSHTVTSVATSTDVELLTSSDSYKLATDSSAIGAAQGSYGDVTEDIDGETRSDSCVGADEESSSTTIMMLTSDDVGPQ